MEDSKILQLLFDRVSDAIEALDKKFGGRLRQTSLNILGDPRDVEEALNDTYLALWNAIPPAKPDPLCAYVYRVGRNSAWKLLRSRTAEKRNSSYDVPLEELAEALPGEDLERTVHARALGRAIDAFLDTLNKEDRVAFVRRYWFGDSIGSIAKHLGIREGTLSVRLHRCRGALKEYLIKEDFWYEA